MRRAKENLSTPYSLLAEGITGYKKLMSPYRRTTNGDLVKHINEAVKVLGPSKDGARKLVETDISKIGTGNISTVAIRILAEYFGVDNASSIAPEVDIRVTPFDYPSTSGAAVPQIRETLSELIRQKTAVPRTTEFENLLKLAGSNPKLVLALLYGTRTGLREDVLQKGEYKELSQLQKDGNIPALRRVVEECIDRNHLRAIDLCELARELAEGSCQPSDDKLKFEPDKDLQESKNFERSRSQILQLQWPKPYRDQYAYVESAIDCLRGHVGGFDDFFVRKDREECIEASVVHPGKLSKDLPPTAYNYAFLYDPRQTIYLNEGTHFTIDLNSKIDEWKTPARFLRPQYLALVRAIRRKEMLEDKVLVGIETGLASVNQKLRLQTCRFSSVVGTHYTAGVSIFGQDGDTVFDGLSHVAHDRYQWMLLRTQACPNVLRISTLLITSDEYAVVIFGPGNSFFTHKTWLPPITGFITKEDLDSAFVADELGVTRKKGPENLELKDLARRTINRKLRDEYGWDPYVVKNFEIVGVALDVVHGRIPTIFTLTMLNETRAELEKAMGDRVYRVFDLVADDRRYSYLEILENRRYQDAEMLKANLFFAIKHETEVRIKDEITGKPTKERNNKQEAPSNEGA